MLIWIVVLSFFKSIDIALAKALSLHAKSNAIGV